MDVKSRRIVFLRLKNGKSPFEEWIQGINSTAFSRAIDARLTRVRDGNFGDHKPVGRGVFELRIPKGPGLRIYYGLDGEEIIVLLGGGDKSSQKKDVKTAIELWRKYKNES